MSARPALPLRRTFGALLLNGLLLCGASAVSSAQSAQKYALQVAVPVSYTHLTLPTNREV